MFINEDRIEAPWTAEQVWSLNEYQASGAMHPFTSENSTELIATPDGWIEHEDGKVIQKWAWAWMADWSWQQLSFNFTSK